jgi:hypothetical protein
LVEGFIDAAQREVAIAVTVEPEDTLPVSGRRHDHDPDNIPF